VVEEVHDVAGKIVTGVRLRDLKTGKVWDQPVDGFFLAIGHIPNTKVFKGQIETDAEGYIVSKGGARTSVPGVFHAGDVQDRTTARPSPPPAPAAWPPWKPNVSGSGRTLNHD
jgi:thioredoxin reductase (NADPH)